MCYRTDLFKAAGLPTDRDAVSALWPTWDDFVTVGQKYVKGSGGKKFVDAATNIMNPVLAQQPVGYFDDDENLKMEGGPKVAWDTVEQGDQARGCPRTSRASRPSGTRPSRTASSPRSPAPRG